MHHLLIHLSADQTIWDLRSFKARRDRKWLSGRSLCAHAALDDEFFWECVFVDLQANLQRDGHKGWGLPCSQLICAETDGFRDVSPGGRPVSGHDGHSLFC